MKKIIYTLVALGIPLVGFSQTTTTTADTIRKGAPSAVQATANNTVLGPGSSNINTGRPLSTTDQIATGKQPGATSSEQTAPRSAVELMEQTKQKQAAQQSGSPH